jgi:hypothetical protein
MGRSSGAWALNDHGLIRNSNDNWIANPVFFNADSWATNWTNDAGLQLFQSTHDGFYKSYSSAAWLVNPTGSDLDFYDTYTPGLNNVDHQIACLARTPDGSAVTSSIMTMFGEGSSRTTTYRSLGDGWYLCHASWTATGSASSQNGVRVIAGQSVIVDNFILTPNTGPVPHLLHGDLPGCYWTGSRHNSRSAVLTANAGIEYAMSDELSGIFTIAGWVTPHFATPAANLADQNIIDYTSGSDVFRITLDAVNEQLDLLKTVSAVNYTNSFNLPASWVFETPVHIAVVQTATQMILYVNGAQVGSALTSPGYVAGDGTLSLDASHMAYDGWRVWRQLLSTSQILQLYTAENTVKATRGRYVGLPPAAIYNAVDYEINNYISSSDNAVKNHFYIIGVNGSTESEVEWRIETADSIPGTYQYPTDIILGRRALLEPIDPDELGFADLAGTVNANDVNGQHQVSNISAGATVYRTVTCDFPEYMRGVGAIVGRYGHNAGDAVIETSPMFHFNATNDDSYHVAEAVTNQVGLFWRYLGPLPFVDYSLEDNPPDNVLIGLKIYNGDSITREIQTDYFQLIPAPFVHIKSGESSTDILLNNVRTVIIKNYNVELFEGMNRRQILYNRTGYQLNVVPGKYNQIYGIMFDVSGINDVGRSFVIKAKITPRYELPGGPIA